MKKIKYLVPSLSLTAVAPVATSLSSCSPIKGQKIELIGFVTKILVSQKN